MMKLKGTIEHETDKAILFHITSDGEGCNLQGQTEWFPKSKTKMNKKIVDGQRIIRIPNWLYEDKIVVNFYNM